MKTTLLVAAMAAGVTLAATAEAREGHGGRMQLPAFEELDANADGNVTLEEIQAAVQARAEAREGFQSSKNEAASSFEKWEPGKKKSADTAKTKKAEPGPETKKLAEERAASKAKAKETAAAHKAKREEAAEPAETPPADEKSDPAA